MVYPIKILFLALSVIKSDSVDDDSKFGIGREIL
jgi:hypothetical protein